MALEKNPNAGKFILPDGYKDLGWQLYSGNSEMVKKIFDEKIPVREFDNSLYKYRCTNVVKICDELKVVWHIDMSD